MTAGAFDTLEAARRLREAGVPEPQAEALADLLRESRDSADLSQLATKADVKADIDALRLSTKADLAEFKAEMIKWFVGIAFAQSALIVTLLKLFPGR